MFGIAIGNDDSRYVYGALYADDVDLIKNTLNVADIGSGEMKPLGLKNYKRLGEKRPFRFSKKYNIPLTDMISEINKCMLDVSTQISPRVLEAIGATDSCGIFTDGVFSVNYMYAYAGDTRIEYNDDGHPVIGGTFFYSDFIRADGSVRTEMLINKKHDFENPCIMVLSIRPERLVKSFNDAEAAAKKDYLCRKAVKRQKLDILWRNGILDAADVFVRDDIIRLPEVAEDSEHGMKINAQTLAEEQNKGTIKLFKNVVGLSAFDSRSKKGFREAIDFGIPGLRE